jgi:uncharacterized membrane protein
VGNRGAHGADIQALLDWLAATVPLLKALHITGLSAWCAGLVALPLMLRHHDPAVTQQDYTVIRHATHLTYTMLVTPAAVIAVIAGTWLIFLREVFTPWLFAKLVFVALLVVVHAWIGRSVAMIAEEPGEHEAPNPFLPISAVLICGLAILVLVLSKPELNWIQFPDWLMHPRGGQLPFEVPS